MDLAQTIAPKSDQMDYEDLLSGARVFTIKEVRRGPSADQPVEIVLEEFERPWRPAKSMRRLLVAAWGPDAAQFVGRRVRLFGDPTVRFGGIEVGGIRVSHLSHIEEPLTVALMARRGQRTPTLVRPLDEPQGVEEIPDEVIADWVATILDTASMTELQRTWADANTQGVAHDPRVIAAKDTRKAQLTEEGQ